MVQASPPARMRQVVRLSAAQRQHARAGMLAANVALESADALMTLQAGHRDAALGLWTELLSDPLAVPQLIAQAGAWVMGREEKLREAERATHVARCHCEDTAQAFAVASARDEVARTIRANASRRYERRVEERFSDEAQDLLLHRRRS
ncbi:hypothetical protein [Telmatospirillum sp.]|uniref:hypothetical protein n=1 Tax=Telmatospirillum sp. TaxID=2079197 RepID=UPI00283B0170|nr:hypothetical protein [Telmatospirillum sp.]MDR3438087.1 hypothetical protein [Telmatospirillum sp.]